MNKDEMYVIRLADGDLIFGEYSFMECDGPEDWTVPEDSEHDDETEYEILHLKVVGRTSKVFGMFEPDEDDEADPDA